MKTLGETLLERGLIARERLSSAVEQSRETHRPLFQILLSDGVVGEESLLRVLAELQGLEFVRLEEYPIQAAAVSRITAKLASHYGIMPVRLQDNVLTIAVSNPLDLSSSEDIETSQRLRVERVLACRGDIQEALRKHYGIGAGTVERILEESAGQTAVPVLEAESHDLEKMAEDASVVGLVNQIFERAIRERATDIHFEIGRDGIFVRQRVDGILYDTAVPKNIRMLYPAIISRIKLMSGLDIVERRLPQDGRARVRIGKSDFDLRISVVPCIHGEDVVVRILPSTMVFDLGQLGFSNRHLDLLKDLIAKPHGILFVTGPTGSGKSTTLYACLSRLNTRQRKVITIEDPIEYELGGLTQTQVNPRIGLTFARALRSMLRHDPDVMLIGEVRDPETAEIAIQTAMTGHLVLSSLHTNDAAGGAVRLMDMGVDPYLITSTVLAFVAQRLVRVICPDCRESYMSDGRVLYRGAGCKACSASGYRGRVAISEFLNLTPEIQSLILARSSAGEIRNRADALGMKTLLQDGMEKVSEGVTTMEELLRVTRM